jgi:hypothetical protein
VLLSKLFFVLLHKVEHTLKVILQKAEAEVDLEHDVGAAKMGHWERVYGCGDDETSDDSLLPKTGSITDAHRPGKPKVSCIHHILYNIYNHSLEPQCPGSSCRNICMCSPLAAAKANICTLFPLCSHSVLVVPDIAFVLYA